MVLGGVPATNVTLERHDHPGTVNATGPFRAAPSQQRGQPHARCGQLEITAANGKKSIDAVTVTVGGKAPIVVTNDAP